MNPDQAMTAHERLAEARLYGILDTGYLSGRDPGLVAETLVAAGADIIQLRAKGVAPAALLKMAHTVRSSIPALHCLMIVNDHADIAEESGADGVHVGQDDGALEAARAVMSPGRLVGRSTHSVEQAVAAAGEGADYIGFGPLFATPTKPEYAPIGLADVRAVHERVAIPIFCIGGVNADRLDAVLQAGAQRVVIVSAWLQAPSIVQYGRELKERLTLWQMRMMR